MYRTVALTLVLTLCLPILPILGAEGPKAGEVDPKSGKLIKYWVAPMDPTYIRDEPGKSPMGMDLVPVFKEEGEQLPASTIRIDPVTIQNMGVRTAPVQRAPLARTIRTLGTITYDETRISAINLKYDGWIEKLWVNFVGETVHKGQKLFAIYSPELISAQEEYLLVLEQVRALQDTPFPAIRKSADRMLAASRQRLRFWDLTPSQIKALEERGQASKLLTIYSPVNGVVIGKKAVEGHLVRAGQHQYDIADLSTIWVDASIYEYELPFVRVGMDVSMDLSYLPGERYIGKVLFIYPFLDKKTRTATLRLSFSNPDGRLKPDMFANVYLESALDDDALLVPQEAVIDSGLRQLVFLDRGEGRFEPREVRLGVEGADSTFQVLDGLTEGDRVVISAQFMLDSESRLREAIEKMLAARSAPPPAPTADDLDMDGMDMQGVDDLDMDDLTMEGVQQSP